MVRFKYLVLTLLLVSSSLFITGCPKDPYTAALKGSDDVAAGVHQSIVTIGKLYSQGVADDAYKAAAGHYLGIVTDCNMSFRKSVVDVHNAGQVGVAAFLPIADSFVSCTQKALPPGGPSSALKAVDSAINGVKLAIASAKGGK